MSKEETRADINGVKDLIAIREKIRGIQQEIKVIYAYVDQTADDFMAHLMPPNDTENGVARLAVAGRMTPRKDGDSWMP